MSYLRHARLFTRPLVAWVLAMFVMSLGATTASAAVDPVRMELVCSTTGAMKLLIKSDSGSDISISHAMDCVLCITTGAPPPAIAQFAVAAQPLFLAAPTLAAAPIATRTGAPLPARGPPAQG